MVVETNAFGIDGGRLVLGLFYILNMQRLFSAETPPPTFVLERLLSCVQIALIANRVFSKTCAEVLRVVVEVF